MPNPDYGAGAAVLDGKLYVIGGISGSTLSTAVQVYNPVTNTWHEAAPYPAPIGRESCGAPAGMIYCAGGASGTYAETSDAYSYNPATNAWSPIAPLPTPMWGSSYTAANGQLLVSGGVVNDSTADTNQGFAYSPWSDTWSPLPNGPRPLCEAGPYLCGSVSSTLVVVPVPGR